MLSRLKRRVTANPWIAPIKPTLMRAQRLRGAARFTARELTRRRVGAIYSLRERPDVSVALRHLTPDIEGFDQIFLQRALEAPPEVLERLHGIVGPLKVLDLGANVGLAAAWFAIAHPGARIVCVEPDPYNAAALRRNAELIGARVIEAAASSREGEIAFDIGHDSRSRASEDGGRTVAAVDVFALDDEERFDVWKVDIEGGEWELLQDPRLADISATVIAMETHPYGGPPGDPFTAAAERFEAAGFHVVRVGHVDLASSDEAALWAWKETTT